MKRLFLLLLAFMVCIPVSSQLITELDQVSPFNEELAAIKKGDQWAFKDKQGAWLGSKLKNKNGRFINTSEYAHF